MLQQLSCRSRAITGTRQATVLKGIGTALPPHELAQSDVLDQARALLAPKYPFFEKLVPTFKNAGVDKRYSVMPLDWFATDHGWADRGAAYMAGAKAMFIALSAISFPSARVVARG